MVTHRVLAFPQQGNSQGPLNGNLWGSFAPTTHPKWVTHRVTFPRQGNSQGDFFSLNRVTHSETLSPSMVACTVILSPAGKLTQQLCPQQGNSQGNFFPQEGDSQGNVSSSMVACMVTFLPNWVTRRGICSPAG